MTDIEKMKKDMKDINNGMKEQSDMLKRIQKTTSESIEIANRLSKELKEIKGLI